MVITDSASIACHVWSQWVLRETSFPKCGGFVFLLWDGPILAEGQLKAILICSYLSTFFSWKSFSTLMMHLVTGWFASIFFFILFRKLLCKKKKRKISDLRFYASEQVCLWIWKGWLGSWWTESGRSLPLPSSGINLFSVGFGDQSHY